METCTGATTQLWRLDPGDLYAAMRIRADSGLLCLAAKGVSGSSVVADVCDDAHQAYLPGVLRSLSRVVVPGVAAAGSAAPVAGGGGQDFFLIKGGQIQLPSVGGGTQYCFDVQDVWDSQFTSGQGGPAPGQRVQVFQCYAGQLNQRWNLTGDITSVNKCLTLAGDATANGAAAQVARCDGSAKQDWDYYW
jgi:hypothetical protein